jgi:hypothetical protein
LGVIQLNGLVGKSSRHRRIHRRVAGLAEDNHHRGSTAPVAGVADPVVRSLAGSFFITRFVVSIVMCVDFQSFQPMVAGALAGI